VCEGVGDNLPAIDTKNSLIVRLFSTQEPRNALFLRFLLIFNESNVDRAYPRPFKPGRTGEDE
ncbi:MAG: hypothetical protein GY806_12355, partial [Gammaproteobacteria bacterium]|nr:hypothetical protein [Gammaproteobacteria bacterium]